MQLHPSIPRPLIAGNDLLSNIGYESIDYKINDIFITETAVPHNPRQVITKIGQKRKKMSKPTKIQIISIKAMISRYQAYID